MNAIPCNGNKTCALIHDTGASHCSTRAKTDFVDHEALLKSKKKISDGIAAGLPIESIGAVECDILTDANKNFTLQLQAHFVPGLKDIHLVLPQDLKTTDSV